MANKTFRAAVVQTLAPLGDLDANIDLLRRYTEQAARLGAKLVVFPECMNTGYLFDSAEHCAKLAEPVNGLFVQAMAELARKYGMHIASGITEKDAAKAKIFNSGVLLDPSGELVLHYHKQFLATHDQNWFAFGERGCPVVDTELGRIGLLICFDGRIPEIARSLALQGAQIIVDMANFFEMDQAEMWVPARALENGVWFVAATKSGVERSIYYPGGSMIVAPSGDVLARMPYDTHGVISAEIDPAAALNKSWHGGGDKFADRRPSTYSILGKPVEETPLPQSLAASLVPEQATTKAAAVQAHATVKPGSLDAALEMASHTAKLGAKVIVLPQHFMNDHWLPDAHEASAAANRADAVLAKLSILAKQYQCLFVASVFETTPSGLAPTAVIIGPDGAEIGRYRQVHLEPEIKKWAVAGDRFTVFDTPFGCVGVLLGYDGMFPESSRALALLGADIVAWPCAWRHRYDRELLAVPKAEDNRLFVVCANRTDSLYPGGSLIIPPNGFPKWDINVSSPPVMRHGAVIPGFINLALARQKKMIPKVDMVRNRLVTTYGPIVASPSAQAVA
ncbi:MAG TPA: carbon-nitrogen hydrolase family protein [Burkholderiales bacterium]